MKETYYTRLGAAYVRGHAQATGTPVLEQRLMRGLGSLTDAEMETVFQAGKDAGLKMYRFKTTHDDLPRVRKVMGFLKGISFESLADVGSGRGVFLFPLLAEFPWVSVTSLDILGHRVAFLQELNAGGITNLTVRQANICDRPLPENCVDVVTMLEVLEHIPNVEDAVGAAVSAAKKYVVVTVPSKEDDNPEHIHLLTKERLTALFTAAGCTKLKFDGVNGHLMMIASVL